MAAYDDDNYQTPQGPAHPNTNKPNINKPRPNPNIKPKLKSSKHISSTSSSGLFADAVKEGWVLKKGPQSYTGWKKRYLQLSSKHQLGYYSDESMVSKKGTIFLKPLTIHHIKRSSKTSDSKHHGFCVVTSKRTYQFCVASSTDRDHWIQKIREVVDDNWDAHKIEKASISYSYTNNQSEKQNIFAIRHTPNGGKVNINHKRRYNDNAYDDWESDEEDNRQIDATLKIKNNMLKDRHDDTNVFVSKYKRRNEQNELITEREAQERIQELEDKNDGLLDEALKTSYDTQYIAADTAQKLDDQRHDLLRIDKDLHEIDQGLDKTEGILDGMKSWSGMIKRKFKKNNETKEEYVGAVSDKSTFERNEHKRQRQREQIGNGVGAQSESQAKISGYDNDADNKQNDKLDELLKSMKALNQTAQDINTELDEHDAIIDAISDKMDKVTPRMQQQSKTMKKICQ